MRASVIFPIVGGIRAHPALRRSRNGSCRPPTRLRGPGSDDQDMIRNRDLPKRRSAAARRTEQRCAECGYGVVIAGSPPRCPLCGSTTWTTSEPRNDAELEEQR